MLFSQKNHEGQFCHKRKLCASMAAIKQKETCAEEMTVIWLPVT
jgi:hypothetical protein